MREYILKRAMFGLATLFIVASLNFVIFQVLSPIDPVSGLIDPKWTQAMKDLVLKQYGLKEPLHTRYLKYISNTLTFNFGISFTTSKPISMEMPPLLFNSIMLLGTALVATILVGIPIGILAASKRGTKLDVATIGAGLFTWGVPIFFIQLLFLFFFSYFLSIQHGIKIFPTAGAHSVPAPTDPLGYMADTAWHYALPVLTLVVGGFGSWALYTRNMLLDALTQDYVTTARAKGLSERTVLYRHAFRSTLPPIVTMITLAVPAVVTGAMISEFIFSLPGVGRWYLDAMMEGDYPVVQSVLFVYAVLTILANIMADILYGVLDPRIRVGIRR